MVAVRVLLMSVVMVVGCTAIGPSDVSIPLELNNNRASLKFAAEGVTYEGVAVLPRQAGIGTSLRFFLPSGTVLFQLGNCHREKVEVRPQGNHIDYMYVPLLYKESEDSCIMEVQATTFKGEIKTAIIDWTDRRTMPAELWCNADYTKPVGVAVCQNRASKLLWIRFPSEVLWETIEGCPEFTASKFAFGTVEYELSIGAGFCPYGFVNQRKEKFRLTTYGYETIQEVNIQAEEIKR